MATPGDTISIVETTALDTAGRFNTIKFTFTGDTVLSEVRLYDFDGILISVLLNVESDVEYALMTGEEVGAWGFYAMPPAPVHGIDFIPNGEDVMSTAVITEIRVGSRTTYVNDLDQTFVILQEVKDERYFGSSSNYGLIIGGAPSEWPRDPVTGTYYKFGEGAPPNTYDYIVDAVVLEAVQSGGDLLPIIGNDEFQQRMNLGMLNTDIFRKYSATVR